MSKEAMKLALEALERMKGYGNVFLHHRHTQNPYEQVCEAITALREALAEQPAQETDQSIMYTFPSKAEPIPYSEPIGILMKLKGDAHMKLYPLAEQPAQQEPVAWVEGEEIYWNNAPDLNDWIRQNGQPLYTSPPAQRDIRNATLDEIATKIEAMPFGDTAASFAVWIREQKT